MGRFRKFHLDWVVVEASGKPRILCERCREVKHLSVPLEAKRLVVLLNAFMQLHGDCVDPKPAQAHLPIAGDP